jgi:hypothetical protein
VRGTACEPPAKIRIFTFGAALVAAAGVLGLPATVSSASAAVRPDITPCVLTAYYPSSNGDVVGGCSTSAEIYGSHLSATGKSYYTTCGRYYRTWAWGYNDGDTGTALSSSYKGCS